MFSIIYNYTAVVGMYVYINNVHMWGFISQHRTWILLDLGIFAFYFSDTKITATKTS